MNSSYLITALVPVGIAVLAVLFCRKLLLRNMVACFLAAFGFFCIFLQSGIVSRSHLPIDSPSPEYRAGFTEAVKKVRDQRPMLFFLYLAMFILAVFPYKKIRLENNNSETDRDNC